MRVGDPDGHGRYGYIDHDSDGLLICHDCGKGCAQLATHARYAHGYASAADYRQAHGLRRSENSRPLPPANACHRHTSGTATYTWKHSRRAATQNAQMPAPYRCAPPPANGRPQPGSVSRSTCAADAGGA